MTTIRPTSDIDAGSWTPTGAASLWEAIDDDPDSPNYSDFAKVSYSAGTSYTLGFQVGLGSFVGDVVSATVRLSAAASDGVTSSADLTLYLVQLRDHAGNVGYQSYPLTAISSGSPTLCVAPLLAQSGTFDWSSASVYVAVSSAAGNVYGQVHALEVDIETDGGTSSNTGVARIFYFMEDE